MYFNQFRRTIDVIKFASLWMSQMTHLTGWFWDQKPEPHTAGQEDHMSSTLRQCCGWHTSAVETKQSLVSVCGYSCKGTKGLLL